MNPDAFTKLFSTIITSSIWSEDDKTRIMWITILACTDMHGYCAGSLIGLADIARVKVEDAEKAILKLESPDKYSSNPANEGRRIQKTERGWLVLNYQDWRNRGRKVERNAYMANFMRRKRANRVLTGAKCSASDSDSDSDSAPNQRNTESEIPVETSEPYRLAQSLVASIGSWKPDLLEIQPARVNRTLLRWAKDVDAMIRLDAREVGRIRELIAWLPSHEGRDGFCWKKNILSAATFRRQFDKLDIAQKTPRGQYAGSNANQRRDEKASREFKEDIHAPLL